MGLFRPGSVLTLEQPIAPVATTIHSRNSIDVQRRRRDGMPSISRPARAAPAPPSPCRLSRDGRSTALLEAAVVFTVKVVVPLPPVAMVTLAGFRLQVGRLGASVGKAVRVQVRSIVPENVLPVVRVAVTVALDPGATEDGTGIAITNGEPVTVVVPLALP